MDERSASVGMNESVKVKERFKSFMPRFREVVSLPKNICYAVHNSREAQVPSGIVLTDKGEPAPILYQVGPRALGQD